MLELDVNAAKEPTQRERFDASRRASRQLFWKFAERLKQDEKVFSELECYCVEDKDRRYYEGARKTIRDVRLELMKVISEGL